MRSSTGAPEVLASRRAGTHLAGSTYSTRVSFRLVIAAIGGYGSAATFSYGAYPRIYRYTRSSSMGLPHSSHSRADSGSCGSEIEVTGSTKGTTARIPAYFRGARLATAPMSRPPAEPPSATIRAASTHGWAAR